ncbi:MAG: hypothetical protein MUC63_08265 [Planctomycetes bacterium]|nr:hypothetical protein [Planctomycetota bacterium]
MGASHPHFEHTKKLLETRIDVLQGLRENTFPSVAAAGRLVLPRRGRSGRAHPAWALTRACRPLQPLEVAA